MEAFFATGCEFSLKILRSEGQESRERSTTSHGASILIAIDGAGADGSAEGRRCIFYSIPGTAVYVKRSKITRAE